ncbi:MAG: PAS domain S-box protein [Planctomycetes bacterium]|nr:PAS domain S-box protein [Planctomycetota bacterium]
MQDESRPRHTPAESSDETRFRAIVEGAPDPIFVQLDGRFAYLNPACCRLFGADGPETLLGRPVLERIHPDSRAMVADRIRRINEQRLPAELLEYRMLALDGREIWAETKGVPTEYDGRAGALVFVRDVGERRRALAWLEQSWRIQRLFLEHAPAAIAMLDREMRHVAVSRRFCSDYRIDDRNIIGRGHYEVFPEISERWRAIHARCLAGATESCDEDPFPRGDGTVDWVRWEIRPWHENDGSIGGIILFTEVITERRRAMEKIRESERKFRAMFDDHAAVKLLVDPVAQVVVDANVAAAAFYGWPLEKLRGMDVAEINPMSGAQLRAERIASIVRREATRFEVQHRLADGSLRDVVVDSSVVEIEGRSLLHSVIHDVTDWKRAEAEREQLRDQLSQAQKMETIGTLAGGVAHDFNNMLGVIRGFAEVALGRTSAGDPLQDDLQAILDASRRATDVTRQLLAFARKQPIAPRVLDLDARIGDLLPLLKRLIGSNIELGWTPGASWLVRMDPTQVDQILVNFCVNARNAIAGIGRIVIETADIVLDDAACARYPDRRPGDYVAMTVTDNGCGMDRETRARIFEPFFTTRDAGEGTGLGLSTVYGIVSQHGGIVDVESEPGCGSSFRVLVPRCEGVDAVTRSESTAPLARGRGESILLVEDEPALLSLGTLLLEQLGYDVLAAQSPREALRIATARTAPIDLVISDIVMPEMDGNELVGRLRDVCPGARCLFVSGYAPDFVSEQGASAPVNFLPKPFSWGELAERVRSTLDGESG